MARRDPGYFGSALQLRRFSPSRPVSADFADQMRPVDSHSFMSFKHMCRALR